MHGDDADVDATDAAGSDGADAATDGSNTADGGAGATAESVDDADAESVDGVDTEHVMNLTFVLTLLLGVPAVVVLSLFVPLDGWNEILAFVVRVGAAIWFLTAVTLYVRERLRN